jgi:hypothetical protein
MKSIKERRQVLECQLTWSDGERKFDGRKAAFPVCLWLLVVYGNKQCNLSRLPQSGNVEIRLRYCGEVLGRGPGLGLGPGLGAEPLVS